MPKKVVVSGYYGFDNFGDDAILEVLVNKLKSLDFEICVLSANPAKTARDYDVNSIKNFDLKNVIKTIFSSNALISGGGSLLQDVTSMKSLIYYSGVIFLAHLFRKPVFIFAQGIGPLNKKFSKFIVLKLLRHAKYVSVRDEKSLKFLNSNGIQAELVNDPVYSVSISDVPKNFAVGVQIRDFATVNLEFLEDLADNLILNFPNRKFELFVFQQSHDEAICKQFINILKLKNPTVDTEIIYYNNRADIFKRIAQLDYMIAMRFHAIIAALKAGVRTACINYDVKVENIAKSATLPLISLTNSDNNYDAIFEHLKSLNPTRLSDFANSKKLNWDMFENKLS